jgi:hypothetical protein
MPACLTLTAATDRKTTLGRTAVDHTCFGGTAGGAKHRPRVYGRGRSGDRDLENLTWLKVAARDPRALLDGQYQRPNVFTRIGVVGGDLP